MALIPLLAPPWHRHSARTLTRSQLAFSTPSHKITLVTAYSVSLHQMVSSTALSTSNLQLLTLSPRLSTLGLHLPLPPSDNG